MRFFTARSLALATLVPALLLFVVVPGCAKQSEGERCGDSVLGVVVSDSEDCGDGLTCTSKGDLLNAGDAHRCCYSDGRVTDSRCERKGTQGVPSAGALSGGASGRAGSGGTGAIAEAGAGGTAEAGAGGIAAIAEAGAGEGG